MLIHHAGYGPGHDFMVVYAVETTRTAVLCTYERWDDLEGVIAKQVVFIFEDDPQDVNLADYFQELTDYDVWDLFGVPMSIRFVRVDEDLEVDAVLDYRPSHLPALKVAV
jgi:hypothetical protein